MYTRYITHVWEVRHIATQSVVRSRPLGVFRGGPIGVLAVSVGSPGFGARPAVCYV